MIPRIWSSPEPDVCKPLQLLCLIRLTSANKRVLSLLNLPVSDSCTLRQAQKNSHSVHKDIDKLFKIALIVPNFNVFRFSSRVVGQISSFLGELCPKIDSHPLGPGIGHGRSPGLSCSRSGWFKAVQEVKNKIKGAIQIFELDHEESRCGEFSLYVYYLMVGVRLAMSCSRSLH
jgi:hypothetical protein